MSNIEEAGGIDGHSKMKPIYGPLINVNYGKGNLKNAMRKRNAATPSKLPKVNGSSKAVFGMVNKKNDLEDAIEATKFVEG